MRVYFSKIIPFGRFTAINLFARLYIKDTDGTKVKYMISRPNRYFRLIQHERTHTKQQNNLLGIFFYIWYVIEWFFKLFTEVKAYKELSFEREARANELDVDEYDVRVHIKDGSILIHWKGINTSNNIINNITNNLINDAKNIKYIEFIPTKTKGSLINRKWGNWLKYVFKRKV